MVIKINPSSRFKKNTFTSHTKGKKRKNMSKKKSYPRKALVTSKKKNKRSLAKKKNKRSLVAILKKKSKKKGGMMEAQYAQAMEKQRKKERAEARERARVEAQARAQARAQEGRDTAYSTEMTGGSPIGQLLARRELSESVEVPSSPRSPRIPVPSVQPWICPLCNHNNTKKNNNCEHCGVGRGFDEQISDYLSEFHILDQELQLYNQKLQLYNQKLQLYNQKLQLYTQDEVSAAKNKEEIEKIKEEIEKIKEEIEKIEKITKKRMDALTEIMSQEGAKMTSGGGEAKRAPVVRKKAPSPAGGRLTGRPSGDSHEGPTEGSWGVLGPRFEGFTKDEIDVRFNADIQSLNQNLNNHESALRSELSVLELIEEGEEERENKIKIQQKIQIITEIKTLLATRIQGFEDKDKKIWVMDQLKPKELNDLLLSLTGIPKK